MYKGITAKIFLGLFGCHAHPRKKYNLHTRLSLTKCIVFFFLMKINRNFFLQKVDLVLYNKVYTKN
jgi:uncharacterized protein YydD (DUF2326 family)